MGNVTNTLLQVCLQDLNGVKYLVSYCLCYVLSDKTSKNLLRRGHTTMLIFDISLPWVLLYTYNKHLIMSLNTNYLLGKQSKTYMKKVSSQKLI